MVFQSKALHFKPNMFQLLPSSEVSALCLIIYMYIFMDNQTITGAVFNNLKKVFNPVNHECLLYKLHM